jgi:hypothetical protein
MTADFDMAAAYAAGGSVRHGRYFVLSIHFILIIVILPSCVYYNTLCRFPIGDEVVDRLIYSRQSSSIVGTRRPRRSSAQEEEMQQMRQQMQMMQSRHMYMRMHQQVITRLPFSYLSVFQINLNAQLIICLLADVRYAGSEI